MKQHFIIDGRLGSLNEYILKCRTGKNGIVGNMYKHKQQEIVIEYIKRSDLERVNEYPLQITFFFYEKNQKRDLDNVSSWAHKCILDALVKTGIIENDGWKQIRSIKDNFEIDKENPRIEVVIETISSE